MNTYKEMNENITSILRLNEDDAVALYAAQRIEELERSMKHAAWMLARETKGSCPKGDGLCSKAGEECMPCAEEYLEKKGKQ